MATLMPKRIDDGGPAFPFKCQGSTTAPEFYYGMTLRDYFAIHFRHPTDFERKHMGELEHARMLADERRIYQCRNASVLEAEWRYARADEMIAARSEVQP